VVSPESCSAGCYAACVPTDPDVKALLTDPTVVED